jgi:hypothetical protein
MTKWKDIIKSQDKGDKILGLLYPGLYTTFDEFNHSMNKLFKVGYKRWLTGVLTEIVTLNENWTDKQYPTKEQEEAFGWDGNQIRGMIRELNITYREIKNIDPKFVSDFERTL